MVLLLMSLLRLKHTPNAGAVSSDIDTQSVKRPIKLTQKHDWINLKG